MCLFPEEFGAEMWEEAWQGHRSARIPHPLGKALRGLDSDAARKADLWQRRHVSVVRESGIRQGMMPGPTLALWKSKDFWPVDEGTVEGPEYQTLAFLVCSRAENPPVCFPLI